MPEVKLRENSFNELIRRRGGSVIYRRSIKCTCWDDSSGQPHYDCKACGGYGYIYDAPIEETHVLVMNLALNKEFTQLGEYRMGDCVMTIPHIKKIMGEDQLWQYPPHPMYDIGERDQVTLLDSEFRTHETLVRGEPILGRLPDTLRQEFVTKILAIIQANPDTGEVKHYGTSLWSCSGSTIQWLTADAPAIGTKYSVLYYNHPTYVVYTQLPQSRDPDGQHMPKRVVIRFKDVI